MERLLLIGTIVLERPHTAHARTDCTNRLLKYEAGLACELFDVPLLVVRRCAEGHVDLAQAARQQPRRSRHEELVEQFLVPAHVRDGRNATFV